MATVVARVAYYVCLLNSLVNTAWIGMVGECKTIVSERVISRHTSFVNVMTSCAINVKKL